MYSMQKNHINVTGSTKRGLIADTNSTYLESCNLTYEFGTALKLGPNVQCRTA